jgi:hypothetical protein
MMSILKFISDKFDINVLGLFIISSLFLLFMDSKEFKEGNFTREYKTARFFGFFNIGFGLVMYILGRIIRA